jgi:hypothetical protein
VENGNKFDSGKPPISLIPGAAIMQTATVLGYGAKKYDAHNFKGGIKYSRLLDAALRHIIAWSEGQDLDEESKHSHLAHASATIAMLIWMAENRPDLDDRYKPERKSSNE